MIMEEARDSFWKSAFLRFLNSMEGGCCIRITPFEEGVVSKVMELFAHGAPLFIEDVHERGYVAVLLATQEEGIEFRCEKDTAFARSLLAMKKPVFKDGGQFLVLQEVA